MSLNFQNATRPVRRLLRGPLGRPNSFDMPPLLKLEFRIPASASPHAEASTASAIRSPVRRILTGTGRWCRRCRSPGQ